MKLRNKNIEKLKDNLYDVLIIGGGINGAVSAAALAARGVKVALIDSRDFAGHTSQQSSNLVWGGIKYMESYEYGLVNNLCKSRNELVRSFPSTVQEIRFLTTVSKGFRFPPRVMIFGTWLYWLLGRAKTRIPRLLSVSQIKSREPLINIKNSTGGIEYSDAYLHDNDARFVFNFVKSAMNRGCIAANYVESLKTKQDDKGNWITHVCDKNTGDEFDIRARVQVNATGAFVDQYNQLTGIDSTYNHVFSKGIHLIVPRISREKRVLAFFADDGRLFFAIPMANRTCIGTTDTIVESPFAEVTDEDRKFVLSNINDQLDLDTPLTESDIIAERCGVRPLVVNKGQKTADDTMQMSRKHAVETSIKNKYISIFGGKLTDCLNVGEEVCQEVQKLGINLKPLHGKWYGEPSDEIRVKYFKLAYRLKIDQNLASDTGELLSERLWRRYGENALVMLESIEQNPLMGETLIEGSGIRRCEIDYLVENEMIVKLEDYLRRRSKLDLIVSRAELKQSKGLMAVCEKLFGKDAEAKYEEYFQPRRIS